ncbi:Protein phosphatase 4 core regulatory subunit R2 [Arabidopsis thaliana x Arabidopsis arenosa]|uniref:Protein phosphatase 4 core regulatory subunit R2 n=1 Tax=Arabidopsis thaliana x Arabidopsis arenosa TaxID=1240361 RepID=A0A8T1YX78_9BRAS|nr:Protein phosphatase 4 core regulatory subunit R2 [Arabidopsis thaliana x Arabidopsis arenosa]
MENPSSSETSEISSVIHPNDGVQRQDHAVLPEVLEHRGAEQIADMSAEEVKGTLEAVASTGKFWQDWEKLKGTLSYWLKKVLSEYSEAKMTDEQQKEALGETYSELVSRLDEALLSFDEGPPFTLQRLCEILLAARSIYPKLSKLALALEKNLLVTSMLAISTDPQSQTVDDPNTSTTDTITTAESCAPNGIDAMGGDKDEIMTEVEEADVDDAMTIDMETIDEPSETMTTTSENETLSENIAAAQPSSDSMAAEEGDSRLPSTCA